MWSDNEAKTDLLGFQHLVSGVVSIVMNDHLLPASIGIFGDWGGGKSSLIDMITADLDSKDGVIVLRFNGWVFEGYEGAKTALMGTILEELMEHEKFLKKASAKAKKGIRKLYRRVNVMKVVGALIKLGAGYYSGGVAGLGIGLSGGVDLATAGHEVLEKAKDVDLEKVKDYIKEDNGDANEDPEKEIRKSVREFRKDFEALLQESKIDKLVIVIDDLDRCSPETIIPTLEAIKLFLFVPKTAFIVAADEELVKYAVRRRFPELPGDRREVGRDYLEKLIQFPVRIPALGQAEVESFMSLLFMTNSSEITAEQKEAAYAKVSSSGSVSLSVSCFNLSVAQEMITPLPSGLSDSLLMVERIAPILGTIMNGNPRQCKRFLNTLLFRLQMAQSRSITLQQRVLAKLMLLEYFKPEFFRRLAELQSVQEGRPTELRQMEEIGKNQGAGGSAKGDGLSKGSPGDEIDGSSGTKLPSEFQPWTSDAWTRDWLTMEPPLASEDLRPYFYFSRENLGLIGTSGQRLSLPARRVLDKVRNTSQAVRLTGIKDVKQLSGVDASAVFEALAERTRREEDLGADSSSLKPMIDVAAARPELLSQLVLALSSLPEAALPVWAPAAAQNACKGTDAEKPCHELLLKWQKSTSNTSLAAATNQVLKMASK